VVPLLEKTISAVLFFESMVAFLKNSIGKKGISSTVVTCVGNLFKRVQ
jgi:hypothetical protein